MDNLLTVKQRSDLYGLQKVIVDQLCYVSKDNIIYHLRDISRKNKKDGWEATGAVPVNTTTTAPSGSYLTEADANTKYVKLQTAYISDPTLAPYQQMYGDLYTSGDLVAYRSSSPTGSFWDNLPIASATVLGGFKVGANLTIDPVTGILNASGGAGTAAWGSISGTLSDQTDLNSALNGKATTIHNLIDTTNHPVSGLTSGHFLKATSPTAYGFAAHGLTASDVNAITKPSSASTDRQILTWDGTSGTLVRVGTGAKIDSAYTMLVDGDVVAYQNSSYSGSIWDAIPVDNVTLKYSSSQVSIKPAITSNALKFLRVDATGTGIEWASAATVDSQWITSGSDIYYSTGRVSIGTNSFGPKLWVYGSDSTTHGSGAAIGIYNAASGGGDWLIRSGATGTYCGAGTLSFGDAISYRVIMRGDYTEFRASGTINGAGYFGQLINDPLYNYPGIFFQGASGYHGYIRIDNGDGFLIRNINSTTNATASSLYFNEAGNISLNAGYSTISGIPSSGNIDLVTQGSGIILNDETSATRHHLHMHGDRIRTYSGTELTYLTTADVGTAAYQNTGYFATAGHGHYQIWTEYTSPGNQVPSYIGGGVLKGMMLWDSSWLWCDTLWFSGYSGSDVKTSNQLVFSKYGANVGFRQQAFDASSWGTLYAFWHTGNLTPSTSATANTVVLRTANGDIYSRYSNAEEFFASGWFRNSSTKCGLYHSGDTNHFYSQGNGLWAVAGSSATTGGIRFLVSHDTTTKGYIYWNSDGFGLLNDQGGWAVRCYNGASYGGKLSGTWYATGDLVAYSS